MDAIATRRLHNTASKEIILSRAPYPQTNLGVKPNGLWYAVGNAWLDWCKTEEPEWIRENTFELDVDTRDIIVLNSYSDMSLFNDTFGEAPSAVTYYKNINWNRVAEKYKGIEIPFYEWHLRYEWIWYYAWDCASGCIWDLSAVKEVRKIEQVTRLA